MVNHPMGESCQAWANLRFHMHEEMENRLEQPWTWWRCKGGASGSPWIGGWVKGSQTPRVSQVHAEEMQRFQNVIELGHFYASYLFFNTPLNTVSSATSLLTVKGSLRMSKPLTVCWLSWELFLTVQPATVFDLPLISCKSFYCSLTGDRGTHWGVFLALGTWSVIGEVWTRHFIKPVGVFLFSSCQKPDVAFWDKACSSSQARSVTGVEIPQPGTRQNPSACTRTGYVPPLLPINITCSRHSLIIDLLFPLSTTHWALRC